MNPVGAKLLEKGAKKAAMKAFKYIKDDQTRSYGLDEMVIFTIEGKGIGAHPAFRTKDGSLEYVPLDVNLARVICYPFPADAKLWNGPDIIRDNNLASMAASLVHDLWWIHADEIAEAWHCERVFALHVGNELLNCIWLMFEPKSRMARIAFGICEWAAPWYHRAKKLVGLAAFAAVFFISGGCGLFNAPEGWRVVSAEGTNAIARAMQSTPTPTPTPTPSSSAGAGAVPEGVVSCSPVSDSAGDFINFASLSWLYGGFRGSGAEPVSGCRIANLAVSGSNMSYAWAEGGCEQLGASSRSDADCLACLFVQGADGAWRGGKFDWISTSRTSRSFSNIQAGYHGWPQNAIETAQAYAFVIVSKDGKRRSNVIVCGR